MRRNSCSSSNRFASVSASAHPCDIATRTMQVVDEAGSDRVAASPIVDGDVLTLDKARFIESLPDECNQMRVYSRRTAAEQSDRWQCTLLRAHSERRGGKRSDNCFDEIASSHHLPQGLGPRQLHR